MKYPTDNQKGKKEAAREKKELQEAEMKISDMVKRQMGDFKDMLAKKARD